LQIILRSPLTGPPKLNIGYRFSVGLQLTENKAM